MRKTLLLVALTVGVPVHGAAQAPGCPQPLAALAVPPQGYAEVNAAQFERRLFVYVPEIRPGGGPGFQAFQVWVVEGVYGRPFVQSSGRLDPASFDSLRSSPNVRASAITVARGDGSDGGSFGFGRARYQVRVLRANPKAGVDVRICP